MVFTILSISFALTSSLPFISYSSNKYGIYVNAYTLSRRCVLFLLSSSTFSSIWFYLSDAVRFSLIVNEIQLLLFTFMLFVEQPASFFCSSSTFSSSLVSHGLLCAWMSKCSAMLIARVRMRQ